MIKEVCDVEVGALINALSVLQWHSGHTPVGGVKGIFAMIEQYPAEFPAELAFNQVMPLYPGYERGLTLISRLIAGQLIGEHTDHQDKKEWGFCTKRIHVPLITNPRAFLKVGACEKNLKVGKAYEIDPTVKHSAWNYGKEDRIHLMFNLLGDPNGL